MKNTGSSEVEEIYAREILDSRGKPTVEATVILKDGSRGIASVPSGASTGSYEAHERRDTHLTRHSGQGVLGAVKAITEEIAPRLFGMCAKEQSEIDRTLRELDGTEDKSRLGANAILAVSLRRRKR